MNTVETLQIESTNSEQTEQLGEQIGAKLRGGEVIELSSDLGGGKTTFVRGLARGSGSSDRVASPTFTISRQYDAPLFTIIHFDFYRLSEAGVMAQELAEFTSNKSFVVVTEWSDVIQSILPDERLRIRISATSDTTRNITCMFPSSLGYLLQHNRHKA